VNDVVRRLQVRIPSKQIAVPEFVVQSMDGVCKQQGVAPGSPSATPSTITYNNGSCP
jgi:hypothetical protein